ncbi:MAG: YcaO-like family protein [Candidatus Omnitrophota bacterium]
MFDKINRPYKEFSPEETVNKIKSILKGINLTPIIAFSGHPYPEIYSVRLQIKDEEGGFGTNGKGRTEQYSVASAYAEFLERIQNGFYQVYSRTFMNLIKDKHGFYYSPDERCLTEKEFLALPQPILEDIIQYRGENKTKFISSYFERLNTNNIPGMVAVPFYDTQNNHKIFLPINLLLSTLGSNGMAAGNTVAEAVFQAICELTERWGAAEIFYKQLIPPTVPREFLRSFKEEYGIIELIEKKGKYQVTVKDFSAGKRLPTLGVIIINLETKKYRLNVGSDTSFQVALSRCLTEIYQGIDNNKRFDDILLDIPKRKPEYFEKEDEEAKAQRYMVFNQFTQNATGQFPPSLFDNEADYPFDPSVFTTNESYEREVQVIIENLHRNGNNIYIRDVSYMGFPSVLVYIPSVSLRGRKNILTSIKTDTFDSIELDKIESLLFDIAKVPNEKLQHITKILENFDLSIPLTQLLKVNIKPSSPWSKLDLSFFCTLLWYKLGEFKKARDNFRKFLDQRKDRWQIDYYKAVEKFLELKITGYDEKVILKKMIEANYSEAITEEVLSDLSDPNNVFKNTKLPHCPNCSVCQLKDDCLTKNKINISHKLYSLMKKNQINQEELSWTIFNQMNK